MMAHHEKYLLHSLSALYIRDITHSKHFTHYPGRGHHCLLQHMHLSFAHGWSVAQPHLITLITPRGARAAPSGIVLAAMIARLRPFPAHTLLVQDQVSLFLKLPSTMTLGNVPALHFARMLRMLEPEGMDSSFGAPSVLARHTLQRYCHVISKNCNVFFCYK